MATRGVKGDAGRNELIRVGANAAALSAIFAKDVKTVKGILAKNRVQFTLTEDGRQLYALRDVAPYLIDLSNVVDVESIIQNISIKKLPPELTKTFWEAKNARRKFLEEGKQLWRTDAVVETLLNVAKVLRQSVNQFVDNLDDRVELSQKQRQLMEEMCDGLLASMREQLQEAFAFYAPSVPEREIEELEEPTSAEDKRPRDEFDD